MGILQKFTDLLSAKSYTGLLPGGLPNGKAWSSGDFLKANELSLYTNKALNKRGEKMAEIQFMVYGKNNEPIPDHPLLETLYYPNDIHSGAQFWKLYQNYIDIVGSAYILLDIEPVLFNRENPKINGIHHLRPDMVKPKVENGKIVHYDYYGPSGLVATYQPEQIVRIFNPDPSNPISGMSMLKAGINAIQTEVQISSYHARVIENGGKVDGVFKFKTPRLTKAQLQELKDGYETEVADARRSGRPLFLGGDAEYTRMGLTPDELAFLETKRLTLDDVCIMTGVPKELMGSLEGTKYSNAEQAVRIFLRETMVPQMRLLTSALDNRLTKDGERLGFIDPTPENIEDKAKLLEAGMKNGLMSTNEGRQVMANLLGVELDAVKGGDDILVAFNLIPLGSSSVVEKDKKKIKTVTEHPLRDAEARKIYYGMQNKRIDLRAEKKFKPVLQTYLNGQRDRLIEKLQPQNTRVFRKKDLIDDSIRLELEVKIGREAFLPLVTTLLEQSGQDAMELVGSSFPFNMSAEVVTWVEQKTDIFLNQINNTTLTKLKLEFAESMEANEGRLELIDRIRGVYDEISAGRANVIARTEVHGLTQFGTFQGYKQANLDIKIWVSVIDKNTRGNDPKDEADHISMDGEEVPIDMPFSNGLMYPGENGAPAAEVINCRCVI
jgi:HK97 family phage portal protein